MERLTSQDGLLRRALALLNESGWGGADVDEAAGTAFIDLREHRIGLSACMVAVARAESQFLFYLDLDFAAPASERSRIAVLVCQLNWGLSIGNFELDMEDGALRFKVSIDFHGDELSDALIRSAVMAAMAAVSRYREALLAAARADHAAAAALADVKPFA